MRNSLPCEYSLGILIVLRVINFFKGLEMNMKKDGEEFVLVSGEFLMQSDQSLQSIVRDEVYRKVEDTKEVFITKIQMDDNGDILAFWEVRD